MGTRSLIHIKKDGTTLATIYQQYDGQMSGVGAEIKRILGNRTIVNGYNDPSTQCNGMGCLAAMLIAGLKKGCGGLYIYPAGEEDVGEDYIYTITAGEREGNAFTSTESIMMHVSRGAHDPALYEGRLKDFDIPEAERREQDQ